jgi:integrase
MSNKKKQPKAKEPVKIRYKTLSNGNQSIYFDIYRNGKRMYEFPKLYLVPEKTPADKEQNRQMLEKAVKIKAQRIDEITNNENGFANMGLKQKANFIDYLQELANEKREAAGGATKGMHQTYESLIKHLTAYKGNRFNFKNITRDFCIGFIEYLQTAQNGVYKRGISELNPSGLLSQATQHNYVRVMSVVLNKAVTEGILPLNPINHLKRYERPKKPDASREYLTIDEVKQLVKTECVKPIVKLAFLFSCFSGLRFSDVKALKWGDFQTDNEGKQLIRYIQQKTQKDEYLQVSDEALKFLPDKGTATDKDTIFILSNNGYTNQALKSWVLAAGVKKRVTFHVGRHTNATLLLSLGVPIETVSKLLGHSDIKTTQIYAKVIDKNKRAAVSKLDGLTD